MSDMTEEVWRPLGFDDAAGAEGYDALHDGIPDWMASSVWAWVQGQVTYTETRGMGRGSYFSASTARDIERICRINIGYYSVMPDQGMAAIEQAARQDGAEIRLLDYLLSRNANAGSTLDKILSEGGSAWKVGTRAGKPGLLRRVPEGAQVAAESVMGSAGQAGNDLRMSWEAAYGASPNPSEAYRLAVRAVEHATIRVVCPKQKDATLGHVIGQLRKDGDWGLPLAREHPDAPTADTVLHMCMALFKGHHDRHGGDPAAPPTVAQDEAEAAVTLAVPLVQWFAGGMVAHRPQV